MMQFSRGFIIYIWLILSCIPAWSCVNNEETEKCCLSECCQKYLNETLLKETCDLGCARCFMK
jgi:hypothetical protein